MLFRSSTSDLQGPVLWRGINAQIIPPLTSIPAPCHCWYTSNPVARPDGVCLEPEADGAVVFVLLGRGGCRCHPHAMCSDTSGSDNVAFRALKRYINVQRCHVQSHKTCAHKAQVDHSVGLNVMHDSHGPPSLHPLPLSPSFSTTSVSIFLHLHTPLILAHGSSLDVDTSKPLRYLLRQVLSRHLRSVSTNTQT